MKSICSRENIANASHLCKAPFGRIEFEGAFRWAMDKGRIVDTLTREQLADEELIRQHLAL
jgi:hypothetical protein